MALPESGEHLADLDEAQYALSGIGAGQPPAVGPARLCRPRHHSHYAPSFLL